MKLFRRIFALALAVVMICLLSASAFAATSYYVQEDYGTGSEASLVEASAEISRYGTEGTLSVFYIDTVGHDLRMDIVLKYYPGGENATMVTKSYTQTSDYYTDTFTFSDTSIFAMYNAKYTFRAVVPAPYGDQIFAPTPVTLEY